MTKKSDGKPRKDPGRNALGGHKERAAAEADGAAATEANGNLPAIVSPPLEADAKLQLVCMKCNTEIESPCTCPAPVYVPKGQRVLAILRASPNWGAVSYRTMAKAFNVDESTARRMCQQLGAENAAPEVTTVVGLDGKTYQKKSKARNPLPSYKRLEKFYNGCGPLFRELDRRTIKFVNEEGPSDGEMTLHAMQWMISKHEDEIAGLNRYIADLLRDGPGTFTWPVPRNRLDHEAPSTEEWRPGHDQNNPDLQADDDAAA